MIRPRADHRAADAYEDLASRLDAGLPAAEGPAGTPTAALRARGIAAAPWEWAALAAGEAAGRAPEVLRELARSRRDRAALNESLVSRLAYPTVVLAMAAALVPLLVSLGLPAPRGWLPSILALTAAAALASGALWWRVRDPRCRVERLPWLGRVLRAAGEVPYLAALRAMYGAGVPLRTAHREATAAARGVWQRARLAAVTPAIEAGEGFAGSLAAQDAMTEETLTLIRDGEAAGNLEDALHRALERRRKELLARAGITARWIGVAVYAVAAGSVLWIALSFYGGLYGRMAR